MSKRPHPWRRRLWWVIYTILVVGVTVLLVGAGYLWLQDTLLTLS